MDYLIGPLAFGSWIDDFFVPPPLGADHSYLAFRISGTPPVSGAARILPRVHVHFNHALDRVYVSHLAHALDLLEMDLGHMTDALTSTIHDVTTRPFSTRTMPQNPWYDDERRALRPYLTRERTLGQMTSLEAHQISRRLTSP